MKTKEYKVHFNDGSTAVIMDVVKMQKKEGWLEFIGEDGEEFAGFELDIVCGYERVRYSKMMEDINKRISKMNDKVEEVSGGKAVSIRDNSSVLTKGVRIIDNK